MLTVRWLGASRATNSPCPSGRMEACSFAGSPLLTTTLMPKLSPVGLKINGAPNRLRVASRSTAGASGTVESPPGEVALPPLPGVVGCVVWPGAVVPDGPWDAEPEPVPDPGPDADPQLAHALTTQASAAARVRQMPYSMSHVLAETLRLWEGWRPEFAPKSGFGAVGSKSSSRSGGVSSLAPGAMSPAPRVNGSGQTAQSSAIDVLQPSAIPAAMAKPDIDDPTRRRTLALGVGLGAAGLAGLSKLGDSMNTQADASIESSASAPVAARLPTVYLPHGGGPWPFVELGFGEPAEWDALAEYLRGLRALPTAEVKALLVVSAHWEEPAFTLMSSPVPPLLYDYYGFPPAAYEISWPAPGQPELAARVRALLEGAGFPTAEDAERGFDHGTFVPLKLTYPDADVPTVQLSLKRGLDPAEHLAMGRALAPLRDEGVFIVGSGMSYHNMRGFGPQGRADSELFDAWLQQTVSLAPAEREAHLSNWLKAPAARRVHPREEHLLPLMVVAGAGADDVASIGFSGMVMGVRVSALHFG